MYFHLTVLSAVVSLSSIAQAAPVDIDSSALANAKVPLAPSFFPPLRLSDLGSANSTLGKRGDDKEDLARLCWDSELKMGISEDEYVERAMDRLIERFPDWNIMAYGQNNIDTDYKHYHSTTDMMKYRGGQTVIPYFHTFVIFKGKGSINNNGNWGWRNWAMYGLYERHGEHATFQAWPGSE